MKQPYLRVAAAGVIGNMLEWYDFGLYGLLAPVLASLFFPSTDRTASLLGVYGGFAIGFAMRPIGAVVLGKLADRVGRRFMLVLSVVLMGAATVAVGLLPTYRTIGIWAPVMLMMIRMFQGFSVGGEFVGSVTYLVEAAPMRRRGIAGSVANWGATAGLLLAAGVAAIATHWIGSARLTTWPWRLPFFLGGVLALFAYYIRQSLPEITDEVPAKNGNDEAPLRQAIQRQPGRLLSTVLFTSGYGIVNYLTMVFLPTFANEFGHIPEYETLRANTAAQALALLIVPFAGWISDAVFTRRAIIAAAFFGEAAISWPAFGLAAHGVSGLWLAQLMFAVLLSMVMGTAPAMLAEQFRSGYRVSAHAVAFNIGIGIFGGTAPMVAIAIIRATSKPVASAAYLIFAAALSFASVLALVDRSRIPLS